MPLKPEQNIKRALPVIKCVQIGRQWSCLTAITLNAIYAYIIQRHWRVGSPGFAGFLHRLAGCAIPFRNEHWRVPLD